MTEGAYNMQPELSIQKSKWKLSVKGVTSPMIPFSMNPKHQTKMYQCLLLGLTAHGLLKFL